MTDSILDTVKKVLQIPEDYTAFDIDIIMHINTVFGILHQLGIGPITGFFITDKAATWGQFLDNEPLLNGVKSYVVLKVRLMFDPPTTSFAIKAQQDQVAELEWRLNVFREGVAHPWPNSPAM